MSPTNKEMQLRKNCQLYLYALVSQDKEIPEEILECAHSFDYEYLVECAVDLSEELKGLDSETFDRIVNNSESKEARELKQWWEMYQEADQLRKTIRQTCL
jgi:hypothetical protein